jgi:hypothetical protein
MTVKANMPTLYARLKKLPWAEIPATSTVTKDHGRRARRTIKVAAVPASITFTAASQIAQLRRAVTKKGKNDRGRLPHHQRRRPHRQPGHPGHLGPQTLAHREQTSLGP